MSFKQYIPDVGREWDAYWKSTSPEQELKLVETDGLRPIFQTYLPRQGEILEAGCGMGKWIIYLTKAGYNIQGIDANTYALEKLRESFSKANVKKGDVRNLPYPDEEFDAYLSLGVVEHFEEGPQKAIKEAFRILRRDGTVIVEVPFDSPLRKLTRFLTRLNLVMKTPARVVVEWLGIRDRRPKMKMRFYEYRYEKKELMTFMKQAGFVDIKIYPKDDLSEEKSIALWLDFPKLKQSKGKIFELNPFGVLLKKVLNAISPYTYCALIVAVARKP